MNSTLRLPSALSARTISIGKSRRQVVQPPKASMTNIIIATVAISLSADVAHTFYKQYVRHQQKKLDEEVSSKNEVEEVDPEVVQGDDIELDDIDLAADENLQQELLEILALYEAQHADDDAEERHDM